MNILISYSWKKKTKNGKSMALELALYEGETAVRYVGRILEADSSRISFQHELTSSDIKVFVEEEIYS